MIINFQEAKERILLKRSNYIGSIGIYMKFAEKIEDISFNYYLYDGIQEDEIEELVCTMLNSIIKEHIGDSDKLNINRNILRICNREYVFYIFLIDNESFFFEWSPDADDEDMIILLHYAYQNLLQ